MSTHVENPPSGETISNEIYDVEETAKNMKPEDIKKLEDREVELLEIQKRKNELKESIAADTQKINELKNEGTENLLDKQAEINKRKEDIQKMLEEAKTVQEEKITDTREKYITAYGASVKKVNPFVKMGYKIGNWLGAGRKDSFTDGDEKNTYEKQKDLKGDKTLDLFVDARVDAKEKARNEKMKDNLDHQEKTPAQIKALKDRYKAMLQNADTKEEKIAKIESALVDGIAGSKDPAKQAEALKKLLEMSGGKEKILGAFKDNKTNEAFSNRDFDFVKNENKTLREKQKEAWEANRNFGERMMKNAGAMIEKNKLARWTIGNKWFRAAAISGAVGFATGGILSPVFWANRVVSVAGGMTGGYLGGLIGRGIIRAQKRLDKQQAELDAAYKYGDLSASDYDTGMQKIDLKRNKYARVKDACALLGAGVGGVSAQVADNHYHFSKTIGNKVHDAIDWTKDKVNDLSWDVGEPDPSQAGSGSSTGNTVGEGNPVDGNAPHPGAEPNEYSIVEAGSGKGFEHSFRAQIEHDQALAEKLKDLYHYKGDISTVEGLHKFSGIAAHKMALAEGYVGPDGSERFIHGTMAPEIHIEGNEVVIHERVLNDGKWIDIDTADRASGHFETDVDRDPSGHIYEKTHMGSHAKIDHSHSQLKTHVEHLRESIVKAYTEEPEYLIEDKPKTDLPTTLKEPSAIDLPPPTKNVIDLPPPTKTVIDLPPPTVNPHPTVPIQNMRPSFTPPGTHGDPMYNTPGRFAEPNPQRGNMLQNLFSKNSGGNELGQNIAMNSAPAQKDFLTILLEGFFGPETPSAPPIPTPDHIPTPLDDRGGGPMTA